MLLVALFRIQNTVSSVSLETKGRKSWKTTKVLTDLEEAKIEFREPEIVHGCTNSLCRGDRPKRWELIRGKPNSNKFQERNSHCPSESTSQPTSATSVLQLTSISAGNKSSPNDLGLVSYSCVFNIVSLLSNGALATCFTDELTVGRPSLAIFHF